MNDPRHFDQEYNRLDYCKLLLPEPGYELTFAVGMTYSLDLEALLSVPVSLGMLEAVDDTALNNPYVILESIRRSSDRIAVFCNADGISMPEDIKPVFALLENSVFCISNKEISNFHPKLWVIQYHSFDGPDIIKVVVLSRNLTFDRSLDIAAELSGFVADECNEKNQPLADMLDFVSKSASLEKQKSINTLKKALMKVANFELSDEFKDYRFVPVGISNKYSASGFGLSEKAEKLLIVSPFLTASLLREICGNALEKTLITRVNSVTEPIWKLFHYSGDKIYVTKDALVDGIVFGETENETESVETDFEENNTRVHTRDLHAKIIYRSTPKGEFISLGSLNASQNAYRHNVEFMLELKYKKGHSSYNDMLEDFLGGNCQVFEELTAFDGEPLTQEEEEHASYLKDVVSALDHAQVTNLGERGYSIIVYCADLKAPAEIAPLFITSKNDLSKLKPLTSGVCFENIVLRDLSEFYVIRRDENICVVKLRTDNIPKERDDEIYSSVITKHGFLSYILFMLADNYAEGISDYEDFKRVLFMNSANGEKTIAPAVYEKLLRAAAFDPKKIDSIEDMMERLKPEIVDDSFRNLIKTFKAAATRKGGHV